MKEESLLVLTKTCDKRTKPSLCFVTAFGNSGKPLELAGEPKYEIPSAEMLLKIDHTAQVIFYLTNKKLANANHPCVDPVEARLSSPALVKAITFE